jgi:hypothetical protein
LTKKTDFGILAFGWRLHEKCCAAQGFFNFPASFSALQALYDTAAYV